MRQGQQNRRGRGRGRKTQNPLARNYESNGPDVKIRGTASHIADKYAALARDAVASGDIIMAENYYQHAEHYYRIIMSVQSQPAAGAQQPAEGANGSGGQRGRRSGGQDGQGEQAQVNAATPAADGAGDAVQTAPNGDGSTEEPRTANGSEKKAAATNGGAEPEEGTAAETEGAPPKNPAA